MASVAGHLDPRRSGRRRPPSRPRRAANRPWTQFVGGRQFLGLAVLDRLRHAVEFVVTWPSSSADSTSARADCTPLAMRPTAWVRLFNGVSSDFASSHATTADSTTHARPPADSSRRMVSCNWADASVRRASNWRSSLVASDMNL
jgi:hypothetical protein